MSMRLNTLKPAVGSKPKSFRVGRGGGSGLGKTCGRGHKGQTARSGYSRKIGFEGGQMPLQRRLPKFGFASLKNKNTAEIALRNLNKIKNSTITVDTLVKANLVNIGTKRVKIFLSGKIERALTLIDICATAGAKKAIEAAGGKFISNN